MSAVTAACLVTRRALFLESGGLDARHLPVNFSDIDYCLRLRAAGWRVVMTPHARLYHHESVSRRPAEGALRRRRAAREAAWMRRRWHAAMLSDPYYHPNFGPFRADFTLGRLVRRPSTPE